jgi:hypothetical protein
MAAGVVALTSNLGGLAALQEEKKEEKGREGLGLK